MPVVAYNDFLLQLQMLNYEQTVNAMQIMLNRMKEFTEISSLTIEKKELSKSERIKKINETLAKISQEEQLSYCDVGIESVREALKNDTW